MNLPKLLHPNQLTPELASSVLQSLQLACATFNTKAQPQRDLHIRDFAFVIEDGQSLLDIYVEPAPGHVGPSPFPPEQLALSLDECLPLHQFLLEEPCLALFDDAIGVRVGSLGIEPPLKTLEHFQSARGHLLTLKTWTKRQGRDRITMILDDVLNDNANPTLRLKDDSESIEVPLTAIKFAQALLSKPKSAKANAHKGQKGLSRARQKA